jgi:hypothetical protein
MLVAREFVQVFFGSGALPNGPEGPVTSNAPLLTFSFRPACGVHWLRNQPDQSSETVAGCF